MATKRVFTDKYLRERSKPVEVTGHAPSCMCDFCAAPHFARYALQLRRALKLVLAIAEVDEDGGYLNDAEMRAVARARAVLPAAGKREEEK